MNVKALEARVIPAGTLPHQGAIPFIHFVWIDEAGAALGDATQEECDAYVNRINQFVGILDGISNPDIKG